MKSMNLYFKYYQERLTNTDLIGKAVVFNQQMLIPVGGDRKIGSECFCLKRHAKTVFLKLKNRKDFPNLKIHYKPDSSGMKWWVLMWGEYPKNFFELSTKERGRLFGYKESVLK